MTAINVIKQKSAVHMLTDGACWLPSGEFGPPCVKAWPLPHLNCVIAARGPRCAPALIADFAGSAANSYADLKLRAPAIIREAVWFYRHAFSLNDKFGGRAEYVVAGWSEVGADAFIVTANDQLQDGGSWTYSECGPVMMAPGNAEIEKAVLTLLPSSVSNADHLDPVRDGLTILNAQRRFRQLSNDHTDTVVGGFAHLTTVTESGINSRIIHRWIEGQP